MQFLSNLLSKAALSAMVLTAPAMITLTSDGAGNGLPPEKTPSLPFYSSVVIKRFVDHPFVVAMRATASFPTAAAAEAPIAAPSVETPSPAGSETREAEVRMVINQANLLYLEMNLAGKGLDQKAFEYAWRGYHNLLKKGMIRKKAMLSICDFSQSSRNKRMYVIDVDHKRLLFRTYVAHGQNSGDEFATSFSNDPDSYKSSLGFYVTQKAYIGRHGLSLRLNGVDSGYNDMAFKRKIVLHGCAYVGDAYLEQFGALGTSLGCPALPSAMSARIIRAVKAGSCLFIYHPTPDYLDNSQIINSL
jgi:hypothetical protein